ncbi:MAG: hypothetical protein LPK85_06940 [Gammaproteobacteria bacterium]|nr:hypothetical protein [Gammaproteobacteria bacterium]
MKTPNPVQTASLTKPTLSERATRTCPLGRDALPTLCRDALRMGLVSGLLALAVMLLLEFGLTGRVLAFGIYVIASLAVAGIVAAVYIWLARRRIR